MVTEQLGMQKAGRLPFAMTMTKSNLHMVPSRQLPRMLQTRVSAKLTAYDPYCSLPVVLNQLNFKLLTGSFCPCKQAAKTHLQSVPSSPDHSHQCWVSHLPSWWPGTTLHAVCQRVFPLRKASARLLGGSLVSRDTSRWIYCLRV